MAVRIRSRFHTEGERSAAALASVAGILGWKLAIDAIKRMRQANYDIDIGRPYHNGVPTWDGEHVIVSMTEEQIGSLPAWD